MNSYLLLIKGSFAEWNNLSESKRTEFIFQFGEFAKELGALGYLKGGAACGERSFRLMNSEMPLNQSLVSPETRDMVTGYFLIEVPNESEALALARKCPAFNCNEYVELIPCG